MIGKTPPMIKTPPAPTWPVQLTDDSALVANVCPVPLTAAYLYRYVLLAGEPPSLHDN